MDFPLVIIELFSLGVTAEALLANIYWKLPFVDDGVDLAQNFSSKGRLHQAFVVSKTRINVLS